MEVLEKKPFTLSLSKCESLLVRIGKGAFRQALRQALDRLNAFGFSICSYFIFLPLTRGEEILWIPD
jgi:hypothetical protein